ncbi:lamin tail domain-containing protein [Gulosibacter bifidus]|uniref:Lamin tail domain-containing protein n=1 Tax=Gulosibacter bifidus TaxID=272239 RepID=A0ABW5RJG5_9MICO|nr:lamin tail domain-containing protein [Gulosibacter bifidus]
MRLRGLTAAVGAAALLSGGFVFAAPAFAAPVSGTVQINEAESNGGTPGDWIELHNTGAEAVDLSGYILRDNDDAHTYVIPDGTTIEAGGFLVFDELDKAGNGHFDFGLGKEDTVRFYTPDGTLVDELAWVGHAADTIGIDPATGEIVPTVSTKGEANTAAPVSSLDGVVLNEIDSAPADAVELYNKGTTSIDLTGAELRDNSNDHRWRFPAGTVIEPDAFLVVDSKSAGQVFQEGQWVDGTFESAIGIGSGDSMRLIETETDLVIDEFSWTEHASYNGSEADATLSRCEDGIGKWKIGTPTLGAANVCVAKIPAPNTDPLPELGDDITVIDETPMFLEDSSGLDYADGHLWAIDNGTGTFWKLVVNDDGTVTPAEGWESGKRIQFAKDAGNPDAKGPDTEGITLDGQGMVYAASERDNAAKDVNMNTILRVDPNAAGPDLPAVAEWDLTAQLPAVEANTGIEAVEWVSNDVLAGKLVDANTGAAYDPATYPEATADGLFFVALEANGHVYAFALNADGTAALVADIDPGLGGAMALDYDHLTNQLWVVADNGFEGRMAALTFNGEATPAVKQYAGSASMTKLNNEGFATVPVDQCIDGNRPAYWFEDGVKVGALKLGAVPCEIAAAPVENPVESTPAVSTASAEPAAAEAGDSNTAEGLAETGADNLTWMLVVAGAIVVIGGGLFLLSRRGRQDDEDDLSDDTPAGDTPAGNAADADPTA